MNLLDMLKMELDIRMEKLEEFERKADFTGDYDAYSRFHSRRIELDSIKSFIVCHEHNYEK